MRCSPQYLDGSCMQHKTGYCGPAEEVEGQSQQLARAIVRIPLPWCMHSTRSLADSLCRPVQPATAPTNRGPAGITGRQGWHCDRLPLLRSVHLHACRKTTWPHLVMRRHARRSICHRLFSREAADSQGWGSQVGHHAHKRRLMKLIRAV